MMKWSYRNDFDIFKIRRVTNDISINILIEAQWHSGSVLVSGSGGPVRSRPRAAVSGRLGSQ